MTTTESAPVSDPPATAADLTARKLTTSLTTLNEELQAWLNRPHRYALSAETLQDLQEQTEDLGRKIAALNEEKPLLVIMLMGGTGVGKSSLLNALAGGKIAQASFVRPTTRDPVVYHHESIDLNRLDPALRNCRLSSHARPELEQKILVDTPDLDSNDLGNRETLRQLLHLADIVLYVGSQEKYHDQLGWELFRQQRQRRAFAFVLNKWDRCVIGEGGLRPDEDLLRDLEAEGFHSPLLFRTCAQHWIDRPPTANGSFSPPADLPKGEQFADLVRWLERGLSHLEIQAVKARGIVQLLSRINQDLESARPPDLTACAGKTQKSWHALLEVECQANVEILLRTLEPFQSEIEHHFAMQGQRRFHGLMAVYLRVFTGTRFLGSTLRDRIPFLPRRSQQTPAATAWDLATFTRACTQMAGEGHLDARRKALSNRLLVEADQQGFPLALLADATESKAQSDYRMHYAQILTECLHEVESSWSKPSGTRRWTQIVLIWLADYLPTVALLAACIRLVWRSLVGEVKLELSDALMPLVILLAILVILHLLILIFLPLKWPNIRGEFQRCLEKKIRSELEQSFGDIPSQTAQMMREERELVERLQGQVHNLQDWLGQSETAGGIIGMYGK